MKLANWSPTLRITIAIAAVVALIYVGLCAAMFVFQRALIYFPHPRSTGHDAAIMTLPVDGAEVLVTTRPHTGPKALVYFGGNAEDVAASLQDLSTAFADHAIYLQHYRGYGGSTGTPSEAALFADANALFDRVQADHRDIVVVGRSLGSGVAVYLASLRPVSRLVLVTPFASIQELAEQEFPYFPMGWLLRDKFESWRYAPRVEAPTLLIATEQDDIVPRASTESLLTRFRAGVATMTVLPGTNHNTVFESAAYLPLLKGPP